MRVLGVGTGWHLKLTFLFASPAGHVPLSVSLSGVISFSSEIVQIALLGNIIA